MKKIAVLVFFVLSALLAGILAEKLMQSDGNFKSDEAGTTVAKQEVKEAAIGKTEKIGSLEWSELFSSDDDISWRKAFEYCENLEKNGHTDWRLPNIDELRTIIKNCPATESGGSCRVSEEKGCLSEECSESCACEMKEENGGYYSRLGDSSALWSNTSDQASSDNAWVVDFNSAGIDNWSKTENFVHNIRCVRQDEHDMCGTAKKYAALYYWFFYLKNFPNGECAGEAKAFVENEDEKKCATARKQNTRAAWEQYLRSFPDGKCAEEGNALINKFRIIDGIEWSNISTERVVGYEAGYYCQDLKENGHDDWRMPEINHLRMLIQNHSGTAAGGRCKISQNRSASYDYSESCSGIKGSNFSIFGDTVELLSSTEAEIVTNTSVYVRDYWCVDFNNGEIDMHSMGAGMHVRCVRCKDRKNCSIFYPEDSKDLEVLEDSEEINTSEKRLKKIGKLEWSSAFRDGSCEELVEDGHSDWRLPNIDELRTLIRNHPGTVSGGKCKISEQNGRLDEKYFDENCYGIEGDDFSKLGDTGWLWSSSPELEDDLYWAVYFDNGGLAPFRRNYFSFFQRCVRQDDLDACATARNYNRPYYWSFYLENYPKGKCAKEANVNLDKMACREAKKVQSRAGWETYLQKFPEGRCSKEARDLVDSLRKVEGLEWSAAYTVEWDKDESYNYESRLTWEKAQNYCNNLKEAGHNDWRMPNIDELRTLVTNEPDIASGGSCKISEKSGNLSEKDFNHDDCEEDHWPEVNIFSKFGDSGTFWSSSAVSNDTDYVWSVNFYRGNIIKDAKSTWGSVRCVRKAY